MEKKKTTLSILLSTFNEARRQARSDAEKKLLVRNKLDNPKKRDGTFEIKETQVNLSGKTVITQQLWKKVDEIRVVISADIKITED